MCIISYKNKGVALPTEEQLRNCEIRNKDGMGVAWLKDGETEVHIKKDFKDVDDLIKWLYDNIKVEDQLIVHFRYATHGLKDNGNRHPFPITKNKKMLRDTELICEMAVAHNGVISQYQHHAKFSDTQKFIVDILADESVKDNLDNVTIRKLVNNFLGGDRLVVLQNSGTAFLWGEWVKEGELYFSNDGYKKVEYKYVGYSYRTDDDANWVKMSDIKKKDKMIVDYCDGCREKHLLMEMIDNEDNVWYLCKKCRKQLRKGKLIEGLTEKKKELISDVGETGLTALEKKSLTEGQCESCLSWYEYKDLTEYYGHLCCKDCDSQVRYSG